MTFNVDLKRFVNDSQDSILFPPDNKQVSRLVFDTLPGSNTYPGYGTHNGTRSGMHVATQLRFRAEWGILIDPSLHRNYQKPANGSQATPIADGNGAIKTTTDPTRHGTETNPSAGLDTVSEKNTTKGSLGTFRILVDGQVWEEWILDPANVQTEKWVSIDRDIPPAKHLTMEWQSTNAYFILGKPLLLQSKKTQTPNVVLIVVDSFRKDFMPCNGFSYNIMPVLTEMCRESVVFENPFSNGNWTKPSMISFLHSQYASNLGINNLWFATLPSHKKIFYQNKIPSLAEAFRRKGYYTESVMNNVFLLDYTTVGVDTGFHHSYQIGKDIDDTEALTDRAIQVVRENAQGQFFLHFNLNTPHGGYAPPDAHLQQVRKILGDTAFYSYNSPLRRYMGELHYTDFEIGRLLQELKKQGIYENTLIVVTGDHGELFDPKHDYHYRYILQGLYGHGETHYDEEINVPYTIKLPGYLQSPNNKTRIPGQSSLLSLTPTILGLTGIDPRGYGYQGVDYSQCILGKSPCPSEDVIYTEGRMSESIRTEQYKYIRRYPGYTMVSRTLEGEKHPMPEELYDLQTDPQEYHNLATLPEHADRLEQARNDLAKLDPLQKNRFHIILPPCSEPCTETGQSYTNGGIYKVETRGIQPQISSSKTLSWNQRQSETPAQIHIHTVNPEPEWNLMVLHKGQSLPIRFGKWGLVSNDPKLRRDGQLLFSYREPMGWKDSSIPWIYNDGRLSGQETNEIQAAMGEEVRKILESWGYIHE